MVINYSMHKYGNTIMAVSILIIFSLFIFNNKLNILNKEPSNNLQIDNKPYITDNFTKRFYSDLLKTLDKYTPDKQIQLSKDNIQTYTSATLPLNIRLEATMVINEILKKINSTSIFNFYLVGIENIKIYEEHKKRQYITNILISDNKNYLNLRFLLNVVIHLKNNIKKRKTECESTTTPGFKTFPIGIPSKDQLIPTPTDVIDTQRNFLSNNCIYEIKSHDINYLYINFIRILNNTNIINSYDQCKYPKIGGITDISLEFNNLENKDNNPYIEKASERNKWPVLKDEPINQGQWPCQPNPMFWNTLGVSPNPVISTKECPGERYSTEPMPLQAQYWPTLGPLPRATGGNVWLFDKSRGIPGFPSGTSN